MLAMRCLKPGPLPLPLDPTNWRVRPHDHPGAPLTNTFYLKQTYFEFYVFFWLGCLAFSEANKSQIYDRFDHLLQIWYEKKNLIWKIYWEMDFEKLNICLADFNSVPQLSLHWLFSCSNCSFSYNGDYYVYLLLSIYDVITVWVLETVIKGMVGGEIGKWGWGGRISGIYSFVWIRPRENLE